MRKISIRKISSADNIVMSEIIRKVMTEFGAVGVGYSIEDSEVDAMYDAYQGNQSVYYVLDENDKIIGGAGIAPLLGGEMGVCELKKMYFLPSARGKGLGRELAERLIKDAKRIGFTYIYIETVARMEDANRLYKKLGFQPLDKPMGNTGYCGCDLFYGMSI